MHSTGKNENSKIKGDFCPIGLCYTFGLSPIAQSVETRLYSCNYAPELKFVSHLVLYALFGGRLACSHFSDGYNIQRPLLATRGSTYRT